MHQNGTELHSNSKELIHLHISIMLTSKIVTMTESEEQQQQQNTGYILS